LGAGRDEVAGARDDGGRDVDGARCAGGGLMRVSAARRPCWSRESWLSVLESTVGRLGAAGRVAGFDGCAGRVDGCDGCDGRESGRDGWTGFQMPLSLVSQLPGRPGCGRYTLPSGPAYTLSGREGAGRVAGCPGRVDGSDGAGRVPGRVTG